MGVTVLGSVITIPLVPIKRPYAKHNFYPSAKSRRGILMITVCGVSCLSTFTLFSLQVVVQIGFIPNLV